MTSARPDPRGFTLLEVMCAFTILAGVISVMVVIWSKNIDTAIWAIDKREMREVADTIFGKILFEQQDHRHGDENTLAVIYGQWAGLPQHRAERYRDYYYSLSKVDMVAAGSVDPNEDAEALVPDSGTDSTSGSTTTGAPATEADQARTSVKLVKFTLKVFRSDEREAPLITLTRYLRPPEIGPAAVPK